MNELLDLAAALDPVTFAETKLAITLDPWQRDLARSGAKREMVLAARQIGKSFTASLIVLHESIFYPNTLNILLAPSQRQSEELLRTIRSFVAALGEDAPLVVSETQTRLELANRSRILALPGSSDKSIRCYSNVNSIVIDEASRLDDMLFHSVTPMLARSQGRLIAMSTPAGRRGWFHKEWADGDGWKRTMVQASECRHLSAEFLEQERQSMGEVLFSQEYDCQFLALANSLFDPLQVEQAFVDDVQVIEGKW
jgi:hypothetical protein